MLTEGCMEEAAESALPLNLSPMCSVVDFSESGCEQRVNEVCHLRVVKEHTLRAAVALSVKDWRPVSDIVKI